MTDVTYPLEISEHVDRGNYHAAINLAISALNEGRRNHDQQQVDRYLEVIQAIALQMAREFGSSEYLHK